MPISTMDGHNESGPNYIGYYKSMLLDLFSKDEDDKLFTLEPDQKAQSDPSGENVGGSFNLKKDGSGSLISFFNNAMGEDISECKKERLKAVIHDTVVSLNHEANEILGQILAKLHIESNIHDKDSVQCFSTPADDHSRKLRCSKKRKLSSDYPILDQSSDILNSLPFKQVCKDIQAIQGDNVICQEAIQKYNNEIFDKVSKMHEDVEELLNGLVSKCRPMSLPEKQQLGLHIQQLPAEALDHVIEMLYPNRSQSTKLTDIFCDLEALDNVVLWRLYYYVQAILKANNTNTAQPQSNYLSRQNFENV